MQGSLALKGKLKGLACTMFGFINQTRVFRRNFFYSRFLIQGSLEEFDALVFHIRDMDGSMPDQMLRKPDQRYVMFLLENPFNTFFPLETLDGFFNW